MTRSRCRIRSPVDPEAVARDLGNATEIMLTRRARLAQTAEAPRPGVRRSGASDALPPGLSASAVPWGAAMTARRVLGPAEARIMAMAGTALLVLALLAAFWPRVIAVPLAAIAMWLAVTLLVRAWILRRERIRSLRANKDAPEDSIHSTGWRRVGSRSARWGAGQDVGRRCRTEVGSSHSRLSRST